MWVYPAFLTFASVLAGGQSAGPPAPPPFPDLSDPKAAIVLPPVRRPTMEFNWRSILKRNSFSEGLA